MRPLILLLALAAAPAGRQALGQYHLWGAFRDASPHRCFAIAEPVNGRHGAWRPFLAITTWPGAAVRGQLHLRLSRAHRPASAVELRIDDAHFPLIAGGADAWAMDAHEDARIVAAIRQGGRLSVAATDSRGRSFHDYYPIEGAASAIDAAAVGCLPG